MASSALSRFNAEISRSFLLRLADVHGESCLYAKYAEKRSEARLFPRCGPQSILHQRHPLGPLLLPVQRSRGLLARPLRFSTMPLDVRVVGAGVDLPHAEGAADAVHKSANQLSGVVSDELLWKHACVQDHFQQAVCRLF